MIQQYVVVNTRTGEPLVKDGKEIVLELDLPEIADGAYGLEWKEVPVSDPPKVSA